MGNTHWDEVEKRRLERGQMAWRGARVIGRIEELDYWDGEEPE